MTHTADDGQLARVRLPGGVLSAPGLRVLARAAVELGDGELHLTSRGNVQLRAVRAPADLAVRLAEAGLLPSQTHERVRNILASPLPGVLDVIPVAGELDRAVCADRVLTDLPGRFLWALDSGARDVAGEDADACWRAVDRASGVLSLGGSDSGVLVPVTRAISALTAVARAFLQVRGPAWRMRELPADVVDRVLAATGPREWYGRLEPAAPLTTPGRHGDAVLAAVPLGVLSAGQAKALADLAPRGVLITPWRSVVLRDAGPAAARGLAAAGLVLTEGSPQAQVSACIGRPGCAKARADVRADAVRAMTALGGRRALRAHVAGCERRCGRPRGESVDVLAVDGGYDVDGVWVPVDRLAESLEWKEHA